MGISQASSQLLTSAVWLSVLGVSGMSGPSCQPQDMLRLDAPYKRPGRPEYPLPFCTEHNGCSCCNTSHVLMMKKRLSGAMEDTSVPHLCRKLTASFTCRVCDPLVGVGWTPRICQAFCDTWYTSCLDSYFEYDPLTGLLVLAAQDSQRSLVSGKLKVLASDGTDMCSQSGAQVQQASSAHQGCWGGASEQIPDGLCESSPSHGAAQDRSVDSGYSLWIMLRNGLSVFVIVWVVRTLAKYQNGASKKSSTQFPGTGYKACR